MTNIKHCCFCDRLIIDNGNSPHPLLNDGDNYNDEVCCDYCYLIILATISSLLFLKYFVEFLISTNKAPTQVVCHFHM